MYLGIKSEIRLRSWKLGTVKIANKPTEKRRWIAVCPCPNTFLHLKKKTYSETIHLPLTFVTGLWYCDKIVLKTSTTIINVIKKIYVHGYFYLGSYLAMLWKCSWSHVVLKKESWISACRVCTPASLTISQTCSFLINFSKKHNTYWLVGRNKNSDLRTILHRD